MLGYMCLISEFKRSIAPDNSKDVHKSQRAFDQGGYIKVHIAHWLVDVLNRVLNKLMIKHVFYIIFYSIL